MIVKIIEFPVSTLLAIHPSEFTTLCTPKAKLYLEYTNLFVFVPQRLCCIWSMLLSMYPKSKVAFGVCCSPSHTYQKRLSAYMAYIQWSVDVVSVEVLAFSVWRLNCTSADLTAVFYTQRCNSENSSISTEIPSLHHSKSRQLPFLQPPGIPRLLLQCRTALERDTLGRASRAPGIPWLLLRLRHCGCTRGVPFRSIIRLDHAYFTRNI